MIYPGVITGGYEYRKNGIIRCFTSGEIGFKFVL